MKCIKRLPVFLRNKWIEVADKIVLTGREPDFSDLARYVQERSRIASSFYGQELAKSQGKVAPQVGKSAQPSKVPSRTTLATISNDVKQVGSLSPVTPSAGAEHSPAPRSGYRCPACGDSHYLDACGKFHSLDKKTACRFFTSSQFVF